MVEETDLEKEETSKMWRKRLLRKQERKLAVVLLFILVTGCNVHFRLFQLRASDGVAVVFFLLLELSEEEIH